MIVRFVFVSNKHMNFSRHLRCSRDTVGDVICVSTDRPTVRFSFPLMTMSGNDFASPIFRLRRITVGVDDDDIVVLLGILRVKQQRKQGKNGKEAVKVVRFVGHDMMMELLVT